MLDDDYNFMIAREDTGMFVDESSRKKVLCISCMHENPPGSQVCESCSEMLPPVTPPPKLEDILVKLEEAVDAFNKREITKKDMDSILVGTRYFLEKKLAEVEAIEIPSDFMTEMKEEMDNGTSGVKALIEACNLLEQYSTSGNRKFMDKGLSLAKVGTDQVNRALRLNWEKFQAFRSMAEEMIRKSLQDKA
ncbi:MAG: hypothetical protein M1269_02715 [Chloroflexi bacterium]|nr:hypothetical protein [Chloroflexota bacterium]